MAKRASTVPIRGIRELGKKLQTIAEDMEIGEVYDVVGDPAPRAMAHAAQEGVAAAELLELQGAILLALADSTGDAMERLSASDSRVKVNTDRHLIQVESCAGQVLAQYSML